MSKKPRNYVTPDIVLELIKRFENRDRIEDIANDLNFSILTIYDWKKKTEKLNCRSFKKPIAKPYKSLKIDKEDVKSMINQGYKLTEIAKKYSVSRQRIHQMKKKLML